MVKLAIRDDDLNFFSKVDDIENVYSEIQSFPVSFAVIPLVTDVSTYGNCSDTKGNDKPRWIGDNHELTEWLRLRLSQNTIDVCMHGITHGYRFINGKRYAEMEWRKEKNLANEISNYRKQLEELLNYNISVFVAPSNKISRYGISCIVQNDMDYSGIIPKNFRRGFTLVNIGNYLKRWGSRVISGLDYPGVLCYSTHKEINACSLSSYDYLIKMFQYCNKHDFPMAINVHYWHLRDNIKARKELISFVNYAIEKGAEPIRISDILNCK